MTYLNAAKSLTPWIGLTKQKSELFIWSDGWPVEYINWAKDFNANNEAVISNKACAYVESDTGTWNVSDCNDQRSFICKITKDSIPTTTVAPPQLCPTDYDWKYFEGSTTEYKCYLFMPRSRTYFDASYDCKLKGDYNIIYFR